MTILANASGPALLVHIHSSDVDVNVEELTTKNKGQGWTEWGETVHDTWQQKIESI